MKKVLYSMMALFCFAIVSCEKEQNIDTPDTTPSEPFEFVLPANIPATLTASYTDTKTDYDADGKFSWTAGDQVALMYVNDLSNPTSQGWVAYEVTSTSNEGRYATFSIVETADNQGRANAMADYTSTGIAIYPASVARPSSGTSEYVSYGKPFFTKPSSLTGSASEVMLIGSPANEEKPTDLKFSTAMAVLKISVSGIPSDAVSFGLYTADQDNYPIAGDYLLNIGGDKEVKLGDYTKYGTDHTGKAYLKASLSGSDTQTFYFNIPTGTYAANTISMKLLDSNENVLLEKTIKKEFTFNRNDLIEVGPYANEWVTLGTGKFIDNFLWGKIIAANNTYSDKLDNDVPGYVPVTIQRNASNTGQYRLVNPYGNAKTQFGYTPRAATTPDPYLNFIISSDGTVSFDTHITGFTLDYRACNIELVCVDSDKNHLVAGEYTAPKVVQLAPKYKYVGEDAAYDQTNKWDMLHIIFPSVGSEYEANVSASSPRLDAFKLTKATGTTYTRLVLSTENAIQMAYNGTIFSGGAEKAFYSSDQANLNWSGKVTTSGVWYLNWFVVNSNAGSGSYVYRQGSYKFYGLSATDAANLIGTYSFTNQWALFHYYRKAWVDIHGQDTNNLVLALSTDPTKGNIMLTKIFGFDFNGYSSEYVVNSSFGGGYNSDLTGTFGAGSPLYGKFVSNTLTFKDAEQNPFMTYTGTHSNESKTWDIYVGTTGGNNQSTRDPSFAFNLSLDGSTAKLTLSSARFMILHFDGSSHTNADNDIIYVNAAGSNTASSLEATRAL